MKLIKRLLFLLFLLFSLYFPNNVNAADFKTNYKAQYFLTQDFEKINSEVKYSINITNLNEGYYVSKFTLSFPKTFSIENIKASDDSGEVIPKVSTEKENIDIELVFNNPNVSLGSQNNFYLTFNQKNLFSINGNVWEVILPVLKKESDENYQVDVILPNNTDKKISISKPAPSTISQNTISWLNPTAKTIYAVFGDNQVYDLKLDYYLYNPKITNGYFDVAFPPDMTNQKIYLKKIDPKPNMTYLDDDGNFIGRYILKPREKIKVAYDALAQIFVKPREEVKAYDLNNLVSQKKYLLNESVYWKIDDISKYKNLKTPQNIYNYLTTTFNYDYDRISKDIKRLGAEFALKNPNMAVCTEFSDSFVALSREKGIFAREIQGYGYSDDSYLRPLSLVADVLHSWPQYYDATKNLWTSIDPTWENTSGIDYFSSFDLNHIAFVIHGRQSNYPLPAGMYKLEDTRDVYVAPTKEKPKEEVILDISTNLPDSINKKRGYKGILNIVNKGNVFLYSVPIEIFSKELQASLSKKNVGTIAPFEEVKIDFIINPNNTNIDKAEIIFKVNNSKTLTKTVKLIDRFYLYIAIGSLFFLILLSFLVIKIRQHKI